ncbi:nitroreductase family protein [Amycolatopsis sp. cmx-4-83]|uniref:nitroreductase family protein n=1 Tax=Amycolatopsis sp. cmx-4-83 TaxID=2790940 RepID=UPI0039793E05
MAARFRWLLVRDPAARAEIAAYNHETAEAAWAEYDHLVEERALKTADFGSPHPAVWSFQLALRARGLGSSSCGYHLQDHESDVAALLGIPDDVTQISLLAVAYTTQRDFRPSARPAVRDITYFDAWERTGSLG